MLWGKWPTLVFVHAVKDLLKTILHSNAPKGEIRLSEVDSEPKITKLAIPTPLWPASFLGQFF